VSESADVVIIGAGPSGLHAARLLGEAGRSVVVLEARDRVGGRMFSPNGLDVGPSWFWSNEPRINRLVGAFGLHTFPQHLAGDAMFQNAEGVQRMDGNQIDAPSGRLVGGMQTLAEAMAAVLDPDVVRLNEEVVSVKVSADPAAGGRLDVVATSGPWSAASVIVALPPATAIGSIDFDETLDSGVRDMAVKAPVWMGQMTKVVARYARPFWRDGGLAGSAFSYTGPMRELHDMSGPDGDPAAVFGFAQPQPGQPAPSTDEVISQLVDLFGSGAAEPTELIIQDWRSEVMTSPKGVEHLTTYQFFGHPLFQTAALGGRLHWSSTETSTEVPGHIEGALGAAERAVGAILQRPRHV